MGRYKVSDDKKAKNLSISLSSKHRKMLDELLKNGRFKKTSDIFQELIENEHLKVFKDRK
ncbi:MAG TPA: hypothetical protein P5136_00465 [Methanofastidiosum sp.]|nr:hypothetical protein [Methanofastidiosum sp.]